MSASVRRIAPAPGRGQGAPALYLTEDEIARAVLGAKHARDWASLAASLEFEGLPKVDPLTGRRYWPAVRAFLDRRHGLIDHVIPVTVDGVERW